MEMGLVLAFALAVLLLSLAPGPDMMFIVANALTGGSRAGLVAALGMSTGLAVHTIAAALGLSALLQAAPGALDAVRLAGAAFLAYMAVSAFRAGRRTHAVDDEATGTSLPRVLAPRRSMRRVYLQATLTNLANPKVVLFYLAFLPQFLSTGGGSWPVATQMLLLGALFIVIGLAVDGSAGLLAGALSRRLLRGPALRRWMERISGTVFGALAVRLTMDAR